MDAGEVIEAIRAGDLDGDLEAVRRACGAREGAAAREAAQRHYTRPAEGEAPFMRVGARVRVRETVRPRYLAGATGVVTDVLQVNVRMVFDRPMGRFGEKELKCPKTLLEVIG